MNWHTRYLQQAKWTRDLRAYLFHKAGLYEARRVLEIGCGTGAILSELPDHIPLQGLDIDPAALTQCRINCPTASLIQGNALQLPYLNNSVDIVYCHFLLLWVRDPIQALLEMKRVTRSGGHILAFAEPDYAARIDRPDELIPLGKWQTESLKRQGADPGVGSQLAALFFEAGINIIETGTIQTVDIEPSPEEWSREWEIIESDLQGVIADKDIQKMERLDRRAWAQGERIFHVPTYFAWGSTCRERDSDLSTI